jgi:hypothetical protein
MKTLAFFFLLGGVGMNAVDICNMALSLLKVTSITSLDGKSEQSIQCKRFYDYVRQNELRSEEWTFARRIKSLTLTTHDAGRWRFGYLYPPDCLNVLAVYEKGNWQGESSVDTYDIFSVSEAERMIACDFEQAILEYTYDMKNVEQFPPDFVKVLVHALATELAIPLTANEGLQQANFSLHQQAKQGALKANHNEDRQHFHFESEILNARLGG